MSLALYMDVHIPAAITAAVQASGVDAITAQADRHGEAADLKILERATELNRVVFNHDSDFLAIAREWQHNQREFTGIVFGPRRRGNQSSEEVIRICVRDLIRICTERDAVPEGMVFLPLRS